MQQPDVSVLNCGAGDMTFSFNKDDPLECARAERVVLDMLSRGYLLFAKIGDNEYTRVLKFDAKTHEYVIADGPVSPAADSKLTLDEAKPAVKRSKYRTKKVLAAETPVTAVAPKAGG